MRYHNTCSVTDILNDLGWRDLAQSVDSRLTVMLKITRGLVDITIAYYVKFQRDGVHLKKTINAREGYYAYSYFHRIISDWTSIPRDTLQTQTLATFERKVATLSHDLPC